MIKNDYSISNLIEKINEKKWLNNLHILQAFVTLHQQNNKTTQIMEIIITAEIEKDILREMKKVSDRIEREMKISFDLRNYELIESDARYLKEMQEALRKGVL